MANPEEQYMRLQAEVAYLEQNPTFQEYMKLKGIIDNGTTIYDLLMRKRKIMQMLENKINQEQQEYEEEPEPRPKKRKMASPEMVEEARNRPVTPQRERELDKKVAMADADFNASEEDAGQVDDLELPDIDDDQ